MIHFDPEQHKYYDGLTELISVTQLLKKHGLATDYSAVPPSVLAKAAEKGTAIHKMIEQYVKGEEVVGEYHDHLNRFVELFDGTFHESEIVVGNDIVAGTVDLIGDDVLADIKTGMTAHKEPWRWQLSIYEYLLRDTHPNIRFIAVIHLTDDFCRWIQLDKVPDEQIEKLFECERNGTIYESTAVIPSDLAVRVQQAEEQLALIETAAKSAKAQADELRKELLEYMEANGIKKWDGDRVSVTYVAPQIRQGVDLEALKKYEPEILHKYPKNTEVKASLRITVKE